MTLSRRDTIRATLFGAGMIGLRALATGLPAALLMNPRKALAGVGEGGACATPAAAQFVVMSTCGSGDPINCNVPGTYEDAGIVHSQDPTMAPTSLTISGSSYTAAAPWAKLPQNVLDRTAFFHLMTDTPVHPREPNVLALMGAIKNAEMFPSLIAKITSGCLGTTQIQPISLGASTPSETILFGGAPMPNIPPLALKATLTSPTGPLTKLQALRDQSMTQLYEIYTNGATQAQKNYVDSLVTSQAQIRNLSQSLMGALAAIPDNTPASQIAAAITLIQMKVTPVIAIHIPFGGDNHNDAALATEATQTVSGVATIASLMSQLAAAGLQDAVSFLSLNVFGRTMSAGNENGRQHNPNHQVSIAIGKPFKGGVYGGLAKVGGDYGALPIVSATGAGSATGDISAIGTLAAFGSTVLTAFGAAAADITANIATGTVIKGALA